MIAFPGGFQAEKPAAAQPEKPMTFLDYRTSAPPHGLAGGLRKCIVTEATHPCTPVRCYSRVEKRLRTIKWSTRVADRMVRVPRQASTNLRARSSFDCACSASSRSRSTSSRAAPPEKDRNPYRRRSSTRCSCPDLRFGSRSAAPRRLTGPGFRVHSHGNRALGKRASKGVN